nr:hypothetical protein Iba_chr13cCG15320 [Ipomoea batatas]
MTSVGIPVHPVEDEGGGGAEAAGSQEPSKDEEGGERCRDEHGAEDNQQGRDNHEADDGGEKLNWEKERNPEQPLEAEPCHFSNSPSLPLASSQLERQPVELLQQVFINQGTSILCMHGVICVVAAAGRLGELRHRHLRHAPPPTVMLRHEGVHCPGIDGSPCCRRPSPCTPSVALSRGRCFFILICLLALQKEKWVSKPLSQWLDVTVECKRKENRNCGGIQKEKKDKKEKMLFSGERQIFLTIGDNHHLRTSLSYLPEHGKSWVSLTSRSCQQDEVAAGETSMEGWSVLRQRGQFPVSQKCAPPNSRKPFSSRLGSPASGHLDVKAAGPYPMLISARPSKLTRSRSSQNL